MARPLDKKYHQHQRQHGLLRESLGSEQAKKPQGALLSFYDRRYKLLLLIPTILFLIALASIGIKYATTGEFLNKDVSLKGGLTMTVYEELAISSDALEQDVSAAFPQASVSISVLRELDGTYRATQILASDLSGDELLSFFREKNLIGTESAASDYELTQTEAVFSEQFFSQLIMSILVAFLFMSITVYIIYRNIVVSFAVVFAALADILITLAFFNITGMTIGAASIAGFLMLIGYSVDTDILLSTRMLREKKGSHLENTLAAAKTGLMMTLTALAAVTVALVFTPSEVLRQIMIVILVGLVVDILTTWVMNAGMLRWYLEYKERKRA